MLVQEIVRAKRDGRELTADELSDFVGGLVDGRVADAQAAAFAMATFFQGMTTAETVAFTTAMTASGTVLQWDVDGPVLDKHSTGGVGDTVSLMLAPLVAACGGYVPMISGRGLGHTGGTFDKFESIPGYRADPDLDTFRSVVRDVGCAVIGQTTDLAPADRRLYSIRDVTATVESIPLITASILSKKLAAGLDALVMDVKVGNGAFLPEPDAARELARSIVRVATGAGLATSALLTAMDQPLAHEAGNALEVAAAIEYLTGRRHQPRLHEVVMALGAEMLMLGGLVSDGRAARARLEDALRTGAGAERFGAMVEALGGPGGIVEHPWRHLERAPVVVPVGALRRGMVRAVDTRRLGLAVVRLGGGRRRPDEAIDHAVGLDRLVSCGDIVDVGDPLAVVHARDRDVAEAVIAEVVAAYEIGDGRPEVFDVVVERVGD